jgi:hypothetical protein
MGRSMAHIAHQPGPVCWAGGVCRWSGWWFWGRSCTSAHTRRVGCSPLQFECLRKTRGARAFRRCAGALEGLARIAELRPRPMFPEGAGGEKKRDQQKSNQPQSYIPLEQLSSAPLRHMGGAGGSYWAIFWLFYAPYKIFRYSGPRLYPLTKSAGLQTSSMSCCPPIYYAHKNIRWYKTRWCVLRRCGFRRPYFFAAM